MRNAIVAVLVPGPVPILAVAPVLGPGLSPDLLPATAMLAETRAILALDMVAAAMIAVTETVVSVEVGMAAAGTDRGPGPVRDHHLLPHRRPQEIALPLPTIVVPTHLVAIKSK